MVRNATYFEIMEKYCGDILSGEIVACKLIRQAVQKFVDELERSKQYDEDFPFEFDRNAVERFCAVFPSFLTHSKGEWADKPFILSPWQVFVVGNLFGWKRRIDGTRRFRKVFLSVARKNGKTSLCSGLELIFLFLDNEPGAEIYIGATKLDQAKLIHDEAETMLKSCRKLLKHAYIKRNNISFPLRNSFARPLGSDKPFSGLNVHAIFFDEFHEWMEFHRKFYSTMTTASGSRRQPLEMIITTAGNDESNLYNEEAEYARGVVDGSIIDDQLFALIYELDEKDDPFKDDFDLDLLIKSNPGYGVSVKPDYLASKLTEAKNKSILKKKDFKRYHGNVSVSSVTQAVNKDVYDSAAAELSDWSKSDGIGAGLDIGGQDDLAAFAMVAKFQIGEEKDRQGESVPIYRYECRSKAYINRNTELRDLNEQPFATWIHEDKLIACDMPIHELETDLYECCVEHGINIIAYDPHQAQSTAEYYDSKGLSPIKCGQNQAHMNEPIRNFLDALKEGRCTPNIYDPVLRWCCLNMSLKTDTKGHSMPDKSKSKDKIDAAVAMLMAFKACAIAQPRYNGKLVF